MLNRAICKSCTFSRRINDGPEQDLPGWICMKTKEKNGRCVPNAHGYPYGPWLDESSSAPAVCGSLHIHERLTPLIEKEASL